jgi:hypothetical protein
MLKPRDAIPHFHVTTLEGAAFSYSSIWQRRNLVLVTVSAADLDGTYVSDLSVRAQDFQDHASVCVVTLESVIGLPARGVVIADRWGEIVHVADVPEPGLLPTPEELFEWIEYVERQCPECEGEAR